MPLLDENKPTLEDVTPLEPGAFFTPAPPTTAPTPPATPTPAPITAPEPIQGLGWKEEGWVDSVGVPELPAAPAPIVTAAPPDVAYAPPEAYKPAGEATVEGRMTGLLSSGSPYIRAARTRAKEEANRRGLLNTSMAAGAGERAAIEAALPIVSQDAAAAFQAGMAGYTGEIAGAQTEQRFAGETELIGTQEKASSRLLTQEGRQTESLATLQADLQSGLSEQESLQKMVEATHSEAIASGLSAQEAGQRSALTSLQGAINSGLQSEAAAQSITLANTQGYIASGLSKQDAGQQSAFATLQAALSIDVLDAETAGKIEIGMAQGLIASGLSLQESEQAIERAKKQAGIETSLIAARRDADLALENVRQAGADHRLEIENTARESLAKLELTSNERTSAAAAFADLGDSYMEQISNIQRDPNITPTAKTTALADVQAQYIQSIQHVADMYEVRVIWVGEETPEEEDEGEDDGEKQITVDTTTPGQTATPDFNVPNFNIPGFDFERPWLNPD